MELIADVVSLLASVVVLGMLIWTTRLIKVTDRHQRAFRDAVLRESTALARTDLTLIESVKRLQDRVDQLENPWGAPAEDGAHESHRGSPDPERPWDGL